MSAIGRVRPSVVAATVLLTMTTIVAVLPAATALVVTTTAVVRRLAITMTRVTATPALLLVSAVPRSMTPTRRRAPAILMTLTMPVLLRLPVAAAAPTSLTHT